MGEIEAAIASVQLTKLEDRIDSRQKAAMRLSQGLSSLLGVKVPDISSGNTHVYYVYGIILDIDKLGVQRSALINALRAEGVPGLMDGYQNVHLLPMFRNKIAYGTNGFPWSSPHCDSEFEYRPGICPVAEELHEKTFLGLNWCMYQYSPADVDLMIKAFQKVWENLNELR